ncbi:hypothetical protein DLD14_12080 [Legionella anisa]|nr:hypothetical protein DLD14_12080 [Legionella anisa]
MPSCALKKVMSIQSNGEQYSIKWQLLIPKPACAGMTELGRICSPCYSPPYSVISAKAPYCPVKAKGIVARP